MAKIRYFLLLLIPSTGQHILPKKLQTYMEPDSPIYDLFPKPVKNVLNGKKK